MYTLWFNNKQNSSRSSKTHFLNYKPWTSKVQYRIILKFIKILRYPKLDYYAIANFGGSSGAQE